MMNLIQVLQEEHQTILRIFDEIDKSQDLQSKRLLIRKLMQTAAVHLKREDDELYPYLRQSPEREYNKIGNIFSLMMQGYAKELNLITMEILSSRENIGSDLSASYDKIRDRIKNRIHIEETILFLIYEKCKESLVEQV